MKSEINVMMEEQEIICELEIMESNPMLVTKPSFRANGELWPGNQIPFIENHLAYLRSHPAVDPKHYLSNLRLMLRKKP